VSIGKLRAFLRSFSRTWNSQFWTVPFLTPVYI